VKPFNINKVLSRRERGAAEMVGIEKEESLPAPGKNEGSKRIRLVDSGREGGSDRLIEVFYKSRAEEEEAALRRKTGTTRSGPSDWRERSDPR